MIAWKDGTDTGTWPWPSVVTGCLYLLALVVVLTGGAPCYAEAATVTPQAIRQRQLAGEPLTLIDIRSAMAFQSGHIPGAINVPAPVAGKKRLPRLGRVVVYGDGILTGITEQARRLLAGKPGIDADLLAGGIGAWQTLRYPLTYGAGLFKKEVRELTYDDLVAAATANGDLVLLDLRPAAQRQTDLAALFPQVPVYAPAWQNGEWDLTPCLPARGNLHQRLFVLIDSGHGEAVPVADRLFALGSFRVAMLVGGELTLARRGVGESRTTETGR